MKRLLTLLAIVLFALTNVSMGCEAEDSADVNQDKIYTDYELFYNSNTDVTWVVARFRFGGPLGTLLELKEPAKVTFEGDELDYNGLFAGHFKEYAGKRDGGTFVYTNVDGETFENSVPAYNEVQFPDGITEISKSEAYDLVWEGDALGEDERVALFIGSWTFGDDALFITEEDGATNLVLDTVRLERLPEGSSKFYMDRSTNVDVEQGTSEGGRIRGKYRANTIDVTVIE